MKFQQPHSSIAKKYLSLILKNLTSRANITIFAFFMVVALCLKLKKNKSGFKIAKQPLIKKLYSFLNNERYCQQPLRTYSNKNKSLMFWNTLSKKDYNCKAVKCPWLMASWNRCAPASQLLIRTTSLLRGMRFRALHLARTAAVWCETLLAALYMQQFVNHPALIVSVGERV